MCLMWWMESDRWIFHFPVLMLTNPCRIWTRLDNFYDFITSFTPPSYPPCRSSLQYVDLIFCGKIRSPRLPEKVGVLGMTLNCTWWWGFWKSGVCGVPLHCRSPPQWVSWYMTQNYLILRFHFWNFRECEVPLHFHYSQGYSDLECLCLIVSHLLGCLTI